MTRGAAKRNEEKWCIHIAQEATKGNTMGLGSQHVRPNSNTQNHDDRSRINRAEETSQQTTFENPLGPTIRQSRWRFTPRPNSSPTPRAVHSLRSPGTRPKLRSLVCLSKAGGFGACSVVPAACFSAIYGCFFVVRLALMTS